MFQLLVCLLIFGTVHSRTLKKSLYDDPFGYEILKDHLQSLEKGIQQINKTLYSQVVGIGSCASVTEPGLYKLACDRCHRQPTVLCGKASFDDGGYLWLVIQQRFDGSLDFNRFWDEYRDGFGIVGGTSEFWLGLESIHQITSAGNYELLIEVKDKANRTGVARYSKFRVGSEGSKYRLEELGKFNGTADCWRCEGLTKMEDRLRYHLGQPFSTLDRDHDQSRTSCAEYYHGGWWYKECAECVLNGSFKEIFNNQKSGIVWPPMTVAAQFSRMMIRRI